ncbi:MAG TPA: type II toxin-antitoxin system HicA family toxin [Acidimicrobiales bacterium]|nr:type II toxin-antitoxin system HicA family toxin [Acidimicrobiales bacterium]
MCTAFLRKLVRLRFASFAESIFVATVVRREDSRDHSSRRVDGWVQVRQRGSHRQFRHPTKPGTVTVPGALGEDLHVELISSIMRQAGLKRRMR